MSNVWTKVIGEKKEWKGMEARAAALPSDYRVVYGDMKKHMFKFASGDGTGVVAVLNEVLDLFETSAAEGRHVLDVTGADVAAFCDQRLRSPSWVETYLDKGRASLNRDIARRLGPAGRQG
jgi:DNA-binding ferritin-like protein (Dps family)